MGDWCDSRNHTLKQKARWHVETNVWWCYRKIFVAVILDYLVRLLDYLGLMGDPIFLLISER